MLPNAMLPNRSIKSLVHRLLFSVDWLHDTCGTIHTGEPACCYLAVLDSYTHTHADISPQKVLTTFAGPLSFEDIYGEKLCDPTVVERFAASDSSPGKRQVSGIPVFAGSGQMRFIDSTNTDWCMIDLYRAPEMLFGLP
jgi:serine/threonine-protein kinase SRPK3